ncbi:MAG: hypothetical protein STSR0009_06580 [Methanoregula sp.]
MPPKVFPRREVQGSIGRTKIRISQLTKTILDQVKEMEHLDTYDDAIHFLFKERRKNFPSTFGCMPNTGVFDRDEEEDPHRFPS